MEEKFDSLKKQLDRDFLKEFARDLADLGASPEQIQQEVQSISEKDPCAREVDLHTLSRQLYDDIRDLGRKLKKLRSLPFHERKEPLSDEQLDELIRENRKQQREAKLSNPKEYIRSSFPPTRLPMKNPSSNLNIVFQKATKKAHNKKAPPTSRTLLVLKILNAYQKA